MRLKSSAAHRTLSTMNPAELLLTGGIALGVVVPMSAAVEASRAPVDMSRFAMSEDCPAVERCIIDTQTERVMGIEPPHAFELTID